MKPINVEDEGEEATEYEMQRNREEQEDEEDEDGHSTEDGRSDAFATPRASTPSLVLEQNTTLTPSAHPAYVSTTTPSELLTHNLVRHERVVQALPLQMDDEAADEATDGDEDEDDGVSSVGSIDSIELDIELQYDAPHTKQKSPQGRQKAESLLLAIPSDDDDELGDASFV